MKSNRGDIAVIACNSGQKFAKNIVEYLTERYNKENLKPTFRLIDSTETHFANGEIKTTINEPIRGVDAYIVQLLDDPLDKYSVNDNFFSLLTAINAAYNSDAETITVVIPQFPNSRQERRKGRESLTAMLASRFMEEAGADRILTIDIHSEAIVGFSKKAKLDNLHASRHIIKALHSYNIIDDNTVMVAPDVGSAETVRYYSRELKKEMAMIVKERDYSKPSTVISAQLVGNVKDKNVVIVDDMIATGGTLIAACKTLKDFGAKSINVAVTFPFFNGSAVEKIDKAYKDGIITTIIGTNAVWRGEEFTKNHPWYKEINITRYFGKVIFEINHMNSISAMLRS